MSSTGTLQVVDYIPTAQSRGVRPQPSIDDALRVQRRNSTCQFIDVAAKLIVHGGPTGAEPKGHAQRVETILYVTSEIADMVHVIDVAAGIISTISSSAPGRVGSRPPITANYGYRTGFRRGDNHRPRSKSGH
jgi:hypothetical protein